MKKGRKKYRILVHCLLGQIKEGFNICIDALPFPVTVEYTNLAEEGIVSKLKFEPHLIVLLFNKEDSDMSLPAKIKLFASEIPLLIILPKIPSSYFHFLKRIGVEKVIQLPEERKEIETAITVMLSMGKITDSRE